MINNSCVILARPNTGDYYEGDGNSLRAISPRPIVSPAQFPWNTSPQPVVFREDSYDPTTRVRRGRFYRQTDGTSYMLEKVQYRPYLPPLVSGYSAEQSPNGADQRRFEFQERYAQNSDLNMALQRSRHYDIGIGSIQAATRWRVIDAEALSDGTTLFTLKSLSAFSLLPVLQTEDIELKDIYEKILDAALKYAPVPVVDVCRESTRVVLAKWLRRIGELDDEKPEDLSQLIDKIPAEYRMVSSAATIVCRLHPRGKSAEQEKQAQKGKTLRSVVDEDAVLAVRLFGFLLVELGFATP